MASGDIYLQANVAVDHIVLDGYEAKVTFVSTAGHTGTSTNLPVSGVSSELDVVGLTLTVEGGSSPAPVDFRDPSKHYVITIAEA